MVGCVDALGSSKDVVHCWKATRQLGAVSDVMNPFLGNHPYLEEVS